MATKANRANGRVASVSRVDPVYVLVAKRVLAGADATRSMALQIMNDRNSITKHHRGLLSGLEPLIVEGEVLLGVRRRDPPLRVVFDSIADCLKLLRQMRDHLTAGDFTEAVDVSMDLAEPLNRGRVALRAVENGSAQQVRAHNSKLFPMGPPDDRYYVEFIESLDLNRGNGKSDAQIARDYTGEPPRNSPNANKLGSRYRADRGRGKVGI